MRARTNERSHSFTHSLTPPIVPRYSLIDLEFTGRRSITHWIHPPVARRSPGGRTTVARLSLTVGNVFEIRFTVCSEPRAELRLEDRGRVGPAHNSEVVQQIRHRRRLPVPRFPQIQDVLGRASLGREVIDVPVTET